MIDMNNNIIPSNHETEHTGSRPRKDETRGNIPSSDNSPDDFEELGGNSQ